MNHKSFIILGSFLTVGCFLLSACGGEQETQEKEVVRPVKVMVLEHSEKSTTRDYPGVTEATDTAKLAFQDAGKVIEIPVKRGQRVKKGELLAKIDPRDFEQDVAETQAAQAEAKADLERYRKLYEEDAVALADLQVREKDYEAAESNLKIAEKALEDTELRAPYDGIVSKKLINNFQNVIAGDAAIRVQNISKIEISIYVPESDAAMAEEDGKGITAVATFDAIPNRVFEIDLKEFETEADETTQTFRVKFIMPQPEDVNVLPGMTANVTLDFNREVEVSSNQFTIPSTAVFSDAQGKAHVWIVQDDLSVMQRQVKMGELTGTAEIKILSGLQPGETLAVSGVRNLREGMKVKAMK